MTSSRDHLFTETFGTRRIGDTVAGLQPDPTPVLSGIACLPLYPVNMNIKISMGVDPSVNLQAIITYGDIDIRQGDVLVIGSGLYNIKWVGPWNWRPGDYYYQVFVEEGLD